MSYQIFQLPPQHPLSAAGRVLPGAKAYFYLTGTSTPADTYEDFDLETEHENPVEADAGGRFPTIYLDPDVTYKVTVTDANDVLLYTIDPANPDTLLQEVSSTVAGSDGAGVVGYRRTESGSVASTVHSVLSRTVWLEDFGGAPGAGDNSAAMNAAIAALAAVGGGTVKLGTCGEWRMNVVITNDNITIEGYGGRGEFDLYCIRPYSLLSAPITFGNGSAELRYCRLINVQMSGTNDPGGVNFDDPSHSAPQCLKLYGVINFVAQNCVFYNGIHTLHIEPSATVPTTDICFINCRARNDLDYTDARTIYGTRLVDPGYFTDVNFVRCKFNCSGTGYLAEFDGTAFGGMAPIFIGGYADCRVHKGILLRGGAALRTFAFDLDPGANGVVFIESDQAQVDNTRILFGYLTQGGQRIQFSGTTHDSGTLQSATSNTATIRAAASFTDNQLVGQVLRILTGTGAGQQRQIESNVGSTDVLTLISNWDTTPDSTSTYDIVKTVSLPSEADWNLYQPRIHRPFFGPICFFSPIATPFDTSMSLERVADGRMQWVGTDVEIGTVGKGFKVKTGSNAKIGTAVLVGGTVAVSNTSVTANSQIFLTRFTAGGTHGDLSYTKSAGVGFTINSTSGTDTSTINYMIVEAIP